MGWQCLSSAFAEPEPVDINPLEIDYFSLESDLLESVVEHNNNGESSLW